MSLFLYFFFLKLKSFQNYFKYQFRQTKISVNHTEPKIHMLQHECKTCGVRLIDDELKEIIRGTTEGLGKLQTKRLSSKSKGWVMEKDRHKLEEDVRLTKRIFENLLTTPSQTTSKPQIILMPIKIRIFFRNSHFSPN
jgi:hypothetical protein